MGGSFRDVRRQSHRRATGAGHAEEVAQIQLDIVREIGDPMTVGRDEGPRDVTAVQPQGQRPADPNPSLSQGQGDQGQQGDTGKVTSEGEHGFFFGGFQGREGRRSLSPYLS